MNKSVAIHHRFEISVLPRRILKAFTGASLGVFFLDALGIYTHPYVTVPFLLAGVFSVSLLMAPKLPLWSDKVDKYQKIRRDRDNKA